jgi:hypothetical protein
MSPAELEPAIPACERPQTRATERVAIGIVVEILSQYYFVPPFLYFSLHIFIHTAFPHYLTHYSCSLPCRLAYFAKTDYSRLSGVSSFAYGWWQEINNVQTSS